MNEPGRRCRLGCYTKFAMDLLAESLWLFSNDINYSVHVALDNETLYVEWENVPILDKSLRQRVARALNRYKYGEHPQSVLKSEHSLLFQAEYVEAAPCLQLIVLQRDEEAKAKWPEIYEKLKGKPLNAIQTMAIETLLREADKAEDAAVFSMREELREGIPYKELRQLYQGDKKKLSILRKICKIRGW